MATASPKPKRRPTVWPARIGIVIALAVAAALTGFLFIPGVGSLVAPIFGEVGDTGPLALSSLFLTGVLALGAIIGWRDPYNPDPLPSADRIEMGNKPTAGLRAEKILEEEYEYAASTAEQAQEHRMTIVNFYLLIAGGAGSGVVALISARHEVANAAGALLWIVALVGGLMMLQLIALRRAWAGSVMEMNYIKEFFVANSDEFMHDDLASAFLWKPRTIPNTHKRGNVYHYSAILIALLNSGAYLGGIFALGLNANVNLTAPGSALTALALSIVFFQAHMWVYDMLLIPAKEPGIAASVPRNNQMAVQAASFVPPPVAKPNIVTSTREIFKGRMVTLRVDDVRLPDGSTSVREIVQHGPAVVIAAYLEDSDEYLFIEQYRDALGKVLVELPAGMVSPGEDSAAAARRELLEETGYEAGMLRYLGDFYTSPGFTDEVLSLYLATQLRQVSGIQDTHEIAALHRVSRAEALRQIAARQITDGKTIIGLLWSDRELPTRV